MIRTMLASSVLAAGLLLVGLSQPAQAGVPLAPLANAVQSSPVENVAWVCGPWRCVWTPGYAGVIAPYAAAWGPPLYPGCYWRRGFLGRWRHVCP